MKSLFTTMALCSVLVSLKAQDQQQDSLTGKQIDLGEVVVSASRANDKIPVTYSKLEKADLEKVNLGQDIPILLNYLPSVVATTFDGTGIGYTDYRIRGADNSRINVTINGIPYNDADSQTTFFINLQDFASSIENIQVQRGVGTSTNGAGAFGGSINILTDTTSEEPFAQLANSIGSFGARKHTARFGTGLLGDHFSFSGRLSKIASDGYIDRAFSDLRSYFFDGAYLDGNTLIKALFFGGEEVAGLSFFGLSQERLQEDRTFNDDGLYLDTNGNVQFYDRQTDNYKQDHIQLHLTQEFDANWTGNLSFHYTDSDGFYEQYNEADFYFNEAIASNLEFYRLPTTDADGNALENTDIITRRHLNSDFFGTTFSLLHKTEHVDAVFGGAFNRYEGEQYGEVTALEYGVLPEIPFRFYENETKKNDFSIYAKSTFTLNAAISFFGDLQLRNVSYLASGDLFDPLAVFGADETYTFFNPKAGITYRHNKQNSIYFSYARGNREPARVDFETGSPEPESLNDFELGWRYVTPKFQLNTNLYLLDFENQLVFTGQLDEVGFPIRTNSGQSYRLGLEVDANATLGKWNLRPNVAMSTNKNQDFLIEDGNGGFTNLGNTDISFSPELIFGNVLTYQLSNAFSASLFSKYVGEQFMTNEKSNPLQSYFVNDLNLQYQVKGISIVKRAVFTAQINNIFNEEYENNGYVFFGESYFFPQAGTNFLLGATFDF